MSGAPDFVEGPIEGIVRITIDRQQRFDIHMSLAFSADPTHFYFGGTPTVATLSVLGLPVMSPNEFKVNLPEGATPPPFFDEALYGGSTGLSMPDGEGTLAADWTLRQIRSSGAAAGQVSYQSRGSSKPFLGEKAWQIKVVMQLRPLSFLDTGSEDNHYEWVASGIVTGLAGVDPMPAQFGRAASGGILTFVLDVSLEPPSATLTAG